MKLLEFLGEFPPYCLLPPRPYCCWHEEAYHFVHMPVDQQAKKAVVTLEELVVMRSLGCYLTEAERKVSGALVTH